MAVCEVLENDIHIERQRIGGLWRIYLTDQITRISLFSTSINLRGIQITLNNRNLLLNQGYSAIKTTRVLLEIFQCHMIIVRLKKPSRMLEPVC